MSQRCTECGALEPHWCAGEANPGLGELSVEIERLRARERRIIDETWGEALMDGSVPSTKIQDKILARINAADQQQPGAKE